VRRRRRKIRNYRRVELTVSNSLIYVYSDGSYDHSRWLQITTSHPGECTLHLQDLCHPGQVSHLLKASCPLGFLQTFIGHGPLQLTTRTGYVLLRKGGERVDIEFRATGDQSLTRVSVLLADFQAQVEALASESTSLRAA